MSLRHDSHAFVGELIEGRVNRGEFFPLRGAAKSLKIRLGKFYIRSCRNILTYNNVHTTMYYVVDNRGDNSLGMG